MPGLERERKKTIPLFLLCLSRLGITHTYAVTSLLGQQNKNIFKNKERRTSAAERLENRTWLGESPDAAIASVNAATASSYFFAEKAALPLAC